MRLPETEEEKEDLARVLFRKGYGGWMPEMLYDLCVWFSRRGKNSSLLKSFAQVAICKERDSQVPVDPLFVKKTPEGKLELTPLGFYLLDWFLENKAIVWDYQKNISRSLSELTDRDLLGLFQKERARCFSGRISIDLYFMSAEGILRRPKLENRFFEF